MEKIFKKLGILLLLLSAACDLDGDLQNPNEVGLAGADVDLIMNGVQLDFADFFNAASGGNIPGTTAFGVDALVRMQAMTTGYRYQTADQAQYTDDLWTLAYQRVLINSATLIPLAQSKNLTTHVAVAKILQAYVYLTLVDLFGDVPQVTALNGAAGNFNPEATPGDEVYSYAITLLDEARVELAKSGSEAGAGLDRDIYYGGDRDKWNALANTLELKALLNLSMIDNSGQARITELLGEDLVDTEEENFTYKYGTATVPVSRHPLYNQFYGGSEGAASGYICNYYLYELYSGKGVQDPRWRYYFYRQVGSLAKAVAVDAKSIGCEAGAIPDHYSNGGYVFCSFDPGFYGRDHGDATGTPPDGKVKTCPGVYPAGGQIDNATDGAHFDPTKRGDGGNGAGIQPIFMSFYTDFMKAEIMQRASGVGADDAAAKAQLATAIQNSIDQVRNFALNLGQELTNATEPSTVAYQNAVATMYDNATNKLDVIGREFWVACWGNGIEAYNNYRRTSAPRDPQPTVRTNPGPFLRSLIYPSVYVNLNSNATQKDVEATNKVFWDTNPDDLQ